jgi:hypothetical protein
MGCPRANVFRIKIVTNVFDCHNDVQYTHFYLHSKSLAFTESYAVKLELWCVSSLLHLDLPDDSPDERQHVLIK